MVKHSPPPTRYPATVAQPRAVTATVPARSHAIPATRFDPAAASVAQAKTAAAIPPTRFAPAAASVAQTKAGAAIPPTRFGPTAASVAQAKAGAAIPPTRFGPTAAAQAKAPGRCLQAMEKKDPFAAFRLKLKQAGISDPERQQEIIDAALQSAEAGTNPKQKDILFKAAIQDAIKNKSAETSKKMAPRIAPANCLHYALMSARARVGGSDILNLPIDWAGESAKIMAWVQAQQKLAPEVRTPYKLANLCGLAFVDLADDNDGIFVGVYDKTTTLGEVGEDERELQDAHYFFGDNGTFSGVPSAADQVIAQVTVTGPRFVQGGALVSTGLGGNIKGKVVVIEWLS